MTAELEWVLVRAFGPPTQITQRVNVACAVELAKQLGLADRIVSRCPDEVAAELGADGARALAFHKLATHAAHRLVVSATEKVISLASSLGIEIVLLKHAALAAAGLVPEGRRDARDLDVLVPGKRVVELERALLESGFSRTGHSPQPHHLAPIRSEQGEVIELHTEVPGLRVGGLPATLETLALANALTEIEISGVKCFIPIPEALVAHTLVHGYVHQATSPLDYPMLRMLGDVIDIGIGLESAERIQDFVRGELSLDEVMTLLATAKLLERGKVPEPETSEGTLLGHVVAAARDRTYQRQLRARRIFSLSDGYARGAILRRLFRPTRADLELVHGKIESEARYFFLARTHALRVIGSFAGDVLCAAKARLRKTH